MSKRARGAASSAAAPTVHASEHPLIAHKVTQLQRADINAREYARLMKEITTLVLYEATQDIALKEIKVTTQEEGAERARPGRSIGEALGLVPILRGGLGMMEAATEMVPTAQVWHLGIYRDKASLLPVEYYNKLPKTVTVDTVFVLDPMPISGSTALAALDIIKDWGASRAEGGRPFRTKLVCLVAKEEALKAIAEAHPDVQVHVGIVDGDPKAPVMASLGDVGDRLYQTS